MGDTTATTGPRAIRATPSGAVPLAAFAASLTWWQRWQRWGRRGEWNELWRIWAPTTPRASRPYLADTRDDSFPGDGDEGGLALLLIFLVDPCVFQRALVRVLKLVPVLGIKRLLHERGIISTKEIQESGRALPHRDLRLCGAATHIRFALALLQGACF